MRRIGRHRRKINKIIILSAFCLLFVITAGYAAFSTNIHLHVKGNILEGTRVIQAWDENSQTDFHSNYYKQNIVSITFLNNNNIPENAVESWNVSEDKERGTVKAWVVPNSEDTSKYDLYIGAKGKVIANKNSSYLFYVFTGLQLIDFNNNFDTSNVTYMSFMFAGNWFQETDTTKQMSIKEIKGLESFDTSNVINMKSMFLFCTELTELNVSSFNTSKVIDMSHMFNRLESLKNIDLSNFDTSKVTDMSRMFRDSGFETLDLSNFNTSNVVNMEGMFFGDLQLTKLNVSSFDTSNVENMREMFFQLQNIKSLNLCNFDTSKVTDMSFIFGELSYIENIYVGSSWMTALANTNGMFSNSGVSSVTTGQC